MRPSSPLPPTSRASIRAAVAVAAFVLACSPPIARADADRVVVERYAALVSSSYAVAIARAEAMDRAVDAFLADPTQPNLAAAREAWIAARAAYAPTEAFRFYAGPIDAPESGPEARINGWPLDEAYVDYVREDPRAGIVNRPDLHPVLNADTIAHANEQGGEENISAGFHAIEFLLWGQDFDAEGPGARPHADYAPGAPNAERRRIYLETVSDLLLQDLRFVAEAWDADRGGYRRAFVRDDPAASLKKIFTGLVMLSLDEISGERMAVAYETRDQEDEQSCFSDTTRADLIGNLAGVERVWLETGLNELVAAQAGSAARRQADEAFDAAKAALAALPQPFDRAIVAPDGSPERKALLAAVEATEALGEALIEAGAALGLELNVEVGEE